MDGGPDMTPSFASRNAEAGEASADGKYSDEYTTPMERAVYHDHEKYFWEKIRLTSESPAHTFFPRFDSRLRLIVIFGTR
jgi:hypothetical protein